MTATAKPSLTVIPGGAKPSRTRKKPVLRVVHARAEEIDWLGATKERLDPQEPLRAEFEQRKRKLVAAVSAEGDADGELVLNGHRYTLVLSARSKERAVEDLNALFDRLGRETFMRVVGARMTELDKLDADLGELIAVERGNRRYKAMVRRAA